MGKNPPLTVAKRAKIGIMHKAGCSERETISRVNVSRIAAHQSVSKFKNWGKFTDINKSGLPIKPCAQDDHEIRTLVVSTPTYFCNKIRLTLSAKCIFQFQHSFNTFHNRLWFIML